METLKNKIDFEMIFTVTKANPNGNPINGNRPREDSNGYGEVSDVCIKRKIRNRLQDMGENIFVQSNDRNLDGYKSLKDRANGVEAMKKAEKEKNNDEYAQIACGTWIDVRAFGQVFAFKGGELSVGVRGPVSVHSAVSCSPIDIADIQITKSVNSVTDKKNPDKKGEDTMGMKHRVEFGVYVLKGSINCQLAQKTGFTDEDAEKVKEALLTLFENDTSSARPDGSMEVKTLYWWKHNCPTGQYSSARVHNSIEVHLKDGIEFPKKFDDYNITLLELEDLTPEILKGR